MERINKKRVIDYFYKKRVINHSHISKTGRRPTNEDIALCEVRRSKEADNHVLLAVADGMGGLKAGDFASQTVYDRLMKFFQEGWSPDIQQVSGKLESCIKAANRGIYDWSQQKKGIQVGTTVSGAVVMGNRALVFNVGDSRTYLVDAKEIKQISKDHSVDREAYDEGIIKKEAIGKGIYSSALTRSVGTDPDVKVDISQKELKKGDILFSCTDGVWNKVTDKEIKAVFDGNRDIEKALKVLYRLAYKKGSKDNISMAAYRYGGHKAGLGVDTRKTPEPTLTEEKKPLKKKFKKTSNIVPTLLISAIIGFLAVVSVLGYRMCVEYKPVDEPPQEHFDETPQGGVIEFDPPGGKFSKETAVRLSMKEPLHFSGGNEIESDIYYTTDGSDPSKNNNSSRIYVDGELVRFNNEGTYTLKTRAISKKGKDKGEIYFQTYIITARTKGGVIKFEPDGGELTKEGTVTLSISEPLKTSNGKEIETDIYYTLDGTEPTRTNGKKYETGEQVDILKNGVLKEGKYIFRARLIPGVGEYKTTVYDRSYTIKTFPPPTVTGGIIKFNPMGGESRDKVTAGLSIDKPLKSQKGEMIDTEIYYTIIDNQSKKQEDWKKYTGTPVVIDREGEYTINARLISKDRAYKGPLQQSRAYIIKKSVPLPPKIETVRDVTQLDNKVIVIDILERIKESIKKIDITIILRGIKNVNNTGLIQLEISISKEGGGAEFKKIFISQKDDNGLVVTTDFTADLEEKFQEIKSALDREIQRIKFPPLTKEKKPVNAVLVVDFKNFKYYNDNLYIW